MHKTDYNGIRHEAPGVRAKEPDPNFAIIGTADSGKYQYDIIMHNAWITWIL